MCVEFHPSAIFAAEMLQSPAEVVVRFTTLRDAGLKIAAIGSMRVTATRRTRRGARAIAFEKKVGTKSRLSIRYNVLKSKMYLR